MAERSYPRHHLLFVNKERQLGASAFHGSVVKFIGRWIQEHLYLGLKFIITYYGDTHLRHIQIKELKTDTTYRQKLLSIQDLDKKKKQKTQDCLNQVISMFPIIVIFQLLSCVQLFGTPWTTGLQTSLAFTTSQSLLQLMFIKLVIPANHLILCCPLLLPSIFPSISLLQ